MPSPAFTIAAGICYARKCGAPEALCRITTISTFMLRILFTVSSKVSPLAVEEVPAEKFSTSALSLLSASSKEKRVRV